MKKIYLLGVSLFLMVAAKAQTNQEMILGYWATDSLDMTMGMLIGEEEVEELMGISEFLSDEMFLEFYGFPMPESQEEWEQLIGTVVYLEDIDDEDITLSYVYFTETHMILYDDGEEMELLYSFVNDTVISVDYLGEDDFPFTQFVINELTENSLILYAEGGFDVEYMMLTIYSTSVDELTLGCMDESAENYNSEAILDDGSCEYGFICDANEVQLMLFDSYGDGWEGSALLINGEFYDFEYGSVQIHCVSEASCYAFATLDGDNMDEATWSLSDADGTIIYEGGLPFQLNDVDGDWVCDDMDNCMDISNSDQLDTDEDGEGDACDYDDGLTLNELNEIEGVLVKMVDVLGREYKVHENGKLLFYLYEDGSVKKILR